MIALLNTNDIGVAGATDWLAKTGLESTKASVSAVEHSFVQLMTSLEKGATPILSQMDMPDQALEQLPTPQGAAGPDQPANAQDGALFLLAMAASVGSAKAGLDPVAAAAAGDDLPVADMDGVALGDQPADFWDVTQITQIQILPVDPDIMADQSTALQPVVLVGVPLDLPHGDIGLARAALVAVTPQDDAALVTASDPGFEGMILPVLAAGPMSAQATADGAVADSVKKMTPDGWKLTVDQMTSPLAGPDAGLGLDALSNPEMAAESPVILLQPGSLALQGDRVTPPLVAAVKMDAVPGTMVSLLTLAQQGADPQQVPVALTGAAQSPATLSALPPVQAGLPAAVAGPDPFAGAARAPMAETAVQITPTQQPADVLTLQTAPSPTVAADGSEDLLNARAAMLPGTGAAPQIGIAKARAQNDMMPAIAPDQAVTGMAVPKTAPLTAEASVIATQHMSRPPVPPTLGADPVLPTMTQIDNASGGAGTASQNGNGQAGSGVGGQAAASLQGQIEAALDVRQQGWTKILVNRAINAAQAGGALTIKILPAHLGQITLKLSEGKRGTDLRIVADVPATAAMLRDVQDQLSSAFDSAGLTLGTYSASTGNNGGESGQKDGPTDQPALSELAIDTVENGDDMARADNLSRINILL
jgi:hypothetical protein